MLTVSALAPGTYFRKWDGALCYLIYVCSGWARIKVLAEGRKLKREFTRADGTTATFETAVLGQRDVALSCEVLEVVGYEEAIDE